MSTNGHQSPRQRLLHVLQLAGGELPLYELTDDYRFSRDQIDDVLEAAHTPIRITLHYNGRPQPTIMVALRSYTPQQPITQKEATTNLNSLSREQYLNLLDPTRKLRLSNKRGHRRTSTSADEYLSPD